MKRHVAILLLCASGCSSFEVPTSSQLNALGLAENPVPPSPFMRCKFRMSVDSPWLTGEFDGVAQAMILAKKVRAQVFGDLGPKVMDLAATPERMVGYFPQTLEGVDCALPGESAPHLLLFMGATLLEDFMPLRRNRVAGIREEDDGTWLRLSPVVPGLVTDVFKGRNGEIVKRRFSWIYGIGWEEARPAPDEWRITAQNIQIRMKIVERDNEPPANLGVFELTLPGDVRVSRGSRK